MKKIIEIIKRKWAEYLLEMLVIIISILGAFFLEQWGEDKLLAEKQNLAMNQLVVDLNNSLTDLDDMQYYYEIRQLSCIKMRKAFWLPERQNYDSIRNYISPTSTKPYNPLMGTARSLINSGNIDLINSAELKSEIISYVESVDSKLHDIDRFKRSYYESGTAALQRNIDYTVLEANYSKNEISDRLQNLTEEQLKWLSIPKDFEKVPFQMTISNIFESQEVYAAYLRLSIAHGNMSEKYGDILLLTKNLIITLEEHGYESNIKNPSTDMILKDSLFQKAVGKYEWSNDLTTFEIIESKQRLLIKTPSGDRVNLEYLGDYNFSVRGTPSKFILNEEKEIVGLSASFDHGEIKALKLK